jgi:hypothetical protein
MTVTSHCCMRERSCGQSHTTEEPEGRPPFAQRWRLHARALELAGTSLLWLRPGARQLDLAVMAAAQSCSLTSVC